MKTDFICYEKLDHQCCLIGRQGGAVMIEAMVAIVVTAVGLLGIVGMLVAGIGSSNKSVYRSTAVYLANEISERMRSNLAGVKADNYVGVGSNSKTCRPTLGTPSPSSCTSGELAAYDVYDWRDQVAKSLPGGSGLVKNVNSVSWTYNQNQYEIEVKWLEDKTSQTEMVFKLRFEP